MIYFSGILNKEMRLNRNHKRGTTCKKDLIKSPFNIPAKPTNTEDVALLVHTDQNTFSHRLELNMNSNRLINTDQQS